MIKLHKGGVFVQDGGTIIPEADATQQGLSGQKEQARTATIAYPILQAHNASGNMRDLQLRFDAMASHDITYVGVIQTAKTSGLDRFPIPYVLTNCHNSLCAVGGTLNEDDHMFGLSAARKYGGINVPAHMAVIHQYMREMHAECGAMILGSDSHTRYGALGTMAIGEGGGELVKQLLRKTYDIPYPEIIGVKLTGKPAAGVGPQDVALALIRAVFENGFVQNKVMEFFGPGIESLSMDFRNGIDVMTTETTCLSSIWETDAKTEEYLRVHGRGGAYKKLQPGTTAFYDGLVEVDLGRIQPMIALPFHPSNAYAISELYENLGDILRETERRAEKLFANNKVSLKLTDKIENGKLRVDQGIIAGCAGGTYENVAVVADMLDGCMVGNGEFDLSVYPSSQPVMAGLIRDGSFEKLVKTGAIMRTAFCGPCFGAGDTPANNGLSIRHTTRNFPNREGSKPGQGQIASVALMDARSIAATALNGGVVTAASEETCRDRERPYVFDVASYQSRIYNGYEKPDAEAALVYGPNIVDWPEMSPLTDNILLKVCSFIEDPVTTTDELIPSGETSTFRSNPLGMAEFTLFRKDPQYVKKAKAVKVLEQERASGGNPAESDAGLRQVYDAIRANPVYTTIDPTAVEYGSVIYAIKPGDGSAREQAASCQRVLGGCANIAQEYATKRYRSNLINWGMIPFILQGTPTFENDQHLFVPDIKKALANGESQVTAYIVEKGMEPVTLTIGPLSDSEKQIILDGCLINYYRG